MKTHLSAKNLADFRAWSDHPEDLSLLGPSPADVGLLLDVRESLLAALRAQEWSKGHFAEACAIGPGPCVDFCRAGREAIAKAEPRG